MTEITVKLANVCKAVLVMPSVVFTHWVVTAVRLFFRVEPQVPEETVVASCSFASIHEAAEAVHQAF